MFNRQTARFCRIIPVALFALVALTPARAIEQNDPAFTADYTLTKVGTFRDGFKTIPEYDTIFQAGGVYSIQCTGIFADTAKMKGAPLPNQITDGVNHPPSGFLASIGRTAGARELSPQELVYITKLDINPKKNVIHFELLTKDEDNRRRAELYFHIDNLESAKPEEVKKIIDTFFVDTATANEAQTKTVKLGMSTDNVKQLLGSPEKIIDLGTKTIYVYKDIKVVFVNSKVSDVQ